MNLNPRAIAVAPVQVTSSSSHGHVPVRAPMSREGGARLQVRSSTPLSRADLEQFHQSNFPRPPTRSVPERSDQDAVTPSAQILVKKAARGGFSSTGDGKVYKNDPVTIKVPKKEGIVSDFDEEIPVRDVFQMIDGHIEDCETHEKHTRKRVGITVICLCSCLLGIFFILMGLAASDMFASMKPNVGILVVGCVLLSPILAWIYVFYGSSKKEVQEQKQMKQNRTYRIDALRQNDARFLIDHDNSRRGLAEARRKADHQKHLDTIEFKKKNPMGYPTLGKTRHPNPW